MAEQLQMIWPVDRMVPWPERQVPPGYLLRGFRDGDEQAYIELMHLAGFGTWNRKNLDLVLKNAVPNGITFAEHVASSRITATAMGWSRPTAIFADAYEMGWVAADPAHKGKGLGQLVVTAVTRVLLGAGTKRIFLMTDDWRLPAINVYLKVGYVPLYYRPDMKMRWSDVFLKLNLNMEEYPGVDLVGDGRTLAANQASHATSEPATGATSSAHEG